MSGLCRLALASVSPWGGGGVRRLLHSQPGVYYINTITLYLQEKSTSLMNENKGIDNPRIKIGKYVGAKAQDKTCVETIQKRTMGLIFNIQNSPVIDFVLTDARNLFRYPAKIRLRQISQLSIFSREKCITKAIEFVMFGFSFRILVSLPFKESLNVTVCKQYGFFSVLTTLD